MMRRGQRARLEDALDVKKQFVRLASPVGEGVVTWVGEVRRTGHETRVRGADLAGATHGWVTSLGEVRRTDGCADVSVGRYID